MLTVPVELIVIIVTVVMASEFSKLRPLEREEVKQIPGQLSKKSWRSVNMKTMTPQQNGAKDKYQW